MMSRRAFTMIELLGVVAIIIILSSLSLVIFKSVQRNADSARTRQILGVLRAGLNQAKADGRSLMPVDHPLKRLRTSAATGIVEGSPGNLKQMDPDFDCYGAFVRKVPWPVHRMPDAKCKVLVDQSTKNEATLGWLLGSTGTLPELVKLRSLYNFVPVENDSEGFRRTYPSTTSWGGALGGYGFDRSNQDRNWAAGSVYGMYFYDAWGTEILVYPSVTNDELTLLSAGPKTVGLTDETFPYFGNPAPTLGTTTQQETDIKRWADNIIDGDP